MFAPVRLAVVLCGILGQHLSVYDLCKYESALEFCAALVLLVWSSSAALHTPTSDYRILLVPLAGLAVANMLRTGISVLAQRLDTWIWVPVDQWRPMVAVILLAFSYATVLGQVGILIIWASASENTQAGDIPNAAETLFRLFVPFVNILSSGLWLLYAPSPPAPEGKDAPKPQVRVTSFVVRDVDLECQNTMCAICLEELSYGNLAGRLPCDHVYHLECVRSWLDNGHSQARCPMRCPSDASSNAGVSPLDDDQSTLGRGMGPVSPEFQGIDRASDRLDIV